MLDFASAANGANGPLFLDSGGAIPAGMLGNYIGTTVQTYNSNLAAISGGTWTGATSLTTLGTIATGTWHGSVIGSAYGGAGTVNGLLKGNGSGTVSLAVAGTDYLAPSGNGSALTGLTWSQLGSTPTTLSGYGITDAYTKTASDARYEVPLTFSTGLTRSTNTITVNYGTTSTTAAVGNDTRFPASVTGLRKSAGAGGTDTAAAAGTDYVAPATTVNGHALSSNVTVSASDLTTGTLPAAQLPNPSASTKGGVQSTTGTVHQWLSSISTSGVPGFASPRSRT